MNDKPGRELPKDYRKVAANLVAAQGWRYKTGKTHSTLYPADKDKAPIVIPYTPSDVRAYENFVAAVRRASGTTD